MQTQASKLGIYYGQSSVAADAAGVLCIVALSQGQSDVLFVESHLAH